MSETFQDWVQTTLRDYEHRPSMITGRLHPLTDYRAQNAAKLAWDNQQEKIDALVEALSLCVAAMKTGMVDINPHDEYVMELATKFIEKHRGEQE